MKELITSKFPLGRIYLTPGAGDALMRARQDPSVFLSRHKRGDWGDVSVEDAAANERSVESGGMILSVYYARDGTKLWIMTEADKSATAILLPDEY